MPNLVNAAYNVIIDVVDPTANATRQDLRVAVVDDFLSGCDKSVETVANTIFPAGLYFRYGAPAFFDVFRDKVLAKVRRNERWSGYYFERMIQYPVPAGEPPNQLWNIVERIRDVELSRFRRSPPTQPIPLLERPFWRFPVDLNAPQFQRLVEFEDAGADVYYVAPRFSSWAAYDRALQDQVVLDKSLLVTPAEIARGAQAQSGPTSVHRIVYDRSRRYVCSDPTPIEEHKPRDVVEKVSVRARDPNRSLESQVAHLFERPGRDRAAARISVARQRRIFARAKRPIDAMATVVGLEAWSQGAQLLLVTGGPAESGI